MDSKKICFIICTNNARYLAEAKYYIDSLNVPEGYTIDLLTVEGAPSMTGGYNEAMRATDAKYKVYMHQDVMIIEKDFLFHLLDVFRDEKVGMFGIVGSRKLPRDAVFIYDNNRIGRLYSSNVFFSPVSDFGVCENDTEVEAVDGLLIATQYDVPWREDIFDGWDFYDVSQCFEFAKAGYKVVVPRTDRPWVIHNDGIISLRNYHKYRKRFIKEYLQD